MPKFLRKPEHVETMEHDDIKFEAMIVGKPTPTVEWWVYSLDRGRSEISETGVWLKAHTHMLTIAILVYS